MGYFKGDTEQVSYSKETVEEINQLGSANLPDRKIPKEVLEKFGVKVAFSQTDGRTIEAIYFPYKNEQDVVTGYKKRDLTLPKDHKYHFTTVGSVSADNMLFGYRPNKPGKKVFLAEGEFDQMSAYWALVSCTNQENFDPQVVGLPLGTGNAAKCVGASHNMKMLNNYQEIVLAFDNDEATAEERKKKIKKGKEATEDISAIFPTKALVADLKDLKDPNDFLQNKRKQELYWCLMKPEVFKPDGFVDIDDIFEEATSIPKMGREWPWESLNKSTYGRRGGEGYFIGAGVKIGKSEFVNELTDFIIENESTPVSLFKLEEKPSMTVRKMAGKRKGKLFHKPDRVNIDGLDFKGNEIPQADLDKYFTQDELKDAVMSLKGKILTYDSYGATSWEQLKKAITYAVVVQGSKDIFIDPITRLTAGMTAAETDVELRKFSDEISKLAKDLDFTYYCFCHLKAPQVGKQHSQGGQVLSEQFRGSRAMMESTYYLVGIERDKSPGLPEVVRNMSTFVVLEDRMFGNTIKFLVYYDVETGRYLEPTEEILEQYYEAIGESYERKDQGVDDEKDIQDFIERTPETNPTADEEPAPWY